MPHSYRVTLEGLSVQPATEHSNKFISFDVRNHDDLFKLVCRVAELRALPDEEVAPFTVGLKLFGEVMLRHRCDPLFIEFYPHVAAFMKRLKGAPDVVTHE